MDKQIVMTPAVRDALLAEQATIEQVRIPAAQRALASISAEVDPEDRADEDLEEQLEVLLRRQEEIREALANGQVIAKPENNEVVALVVGIGTLTSMPVLMRPFAAQPPRPTSPATATTT